MAKKQTKKKKAPPKMFTLIRSALRRISSFHHQPIKDCLALARVPAPAGMKVKYLYKCAKCNRLFPLKEVAVDHIEEIGGFDSFKSLGEWCERLFCDISNLQVLCDECHGIKTYASRYGVTEEEAVLRKKLAAFKQLSIADMQQLLYNVHVSPVKTKAGMSKQYECFLKGE